MWWWSCTGDDGKSSPLRSSTTSTPAYEKLAFEARTTTFIACCDWFVSFSASFEQCNLYTSRWNQGLPRGIFQYSEKSANGENLWNLFRSARAVMPMCGLEQHQQHYCKWFYLSVWYLRPPYNPNVSIQTLTRLVSCISKKQVLTLLWRPSPDTGDQRRAVMQTLRRQVESQLENNYWNEFTFLVGIATKTLHIPLSIMNPVRYSSLNCSQWPTSQAETIDIRLAHQEFCSPYCLNYVNPNTAYVDGGWRLWGSLPAPNAYPFVMNKTWMLY